MVESISRKVNLDANEMISKDGSLCDVINSVREMMRKARTLKMLRCYEI